MAVWHLKEVRTALEAKGWKISELPGDGYRYSAMWRIRRGDERRPFVLRFLGLDDMETLPIDKAYACDIQDLKTSLYFRRRGAPGSRARETWLRELREFVRALESASTASSTPEGR